MSIIERTTTRDNRLFRPDYPIDRAVRALRAELDDRAYNPQYSRLICQSAHATHALADAIDEGWICPEDIDGLTSAFVEGFGEVHQSDPSWNDAARWEPTEHPTPDEARQYAELIGAFDLPSDPSPPADLEPSDSDWDEMAIWSAMLDASCPYEEFEIAEAGIHRR